MVCPEMESSYGYSEHEVKYEMFTGSFHGLFISKHSTIPPLTLNDSPGKCTCFQSLSSMHQKHRLNSQHSYIHICMPPASHLFRTGILGATVSGMSRNGKLT